MMFHLHPHAALSAGFLLLFSGLSSCTLLPVFSSGNQETPQTLGARMEKHTEVLQKDIGARNASQPKAMEAAAKYIAGCFSDMGYAVTMQPVSGGGAKKGAAIYNILVYKPGLYSNNQSIVVGANYDSGRQHNNGSGAALLLETARSLKDIPTNRNIYFVAYANGAESAEPSSPSGACVHGTTLSGNIGAANILGMINLEPQELAACGERKQKEPDSRHEAVLFITTPRGREFAGQCAAPFANSWGQAPSTFHREPSALTGNDRHYAALGIPTVSCRCKYPATDTRTEEYIQALTDMIHQAADNATPKPEKDAAQGGKTPDSSPPLSFNKHVY